MSRARGNGRRGKDDRIESVHLTGQPSSRASSRDNLTTDRTSYFRQYRAALGQSNPSFMPDLPSHLTLGSGVAVGGHPKGAGLRARASSLHPTDEPAGSRPDTNSRPLNRRSLMRTAFVLSFVSAAVFGLLSFARWQPEDVSSQLPLESDLAGTEDEAYLFVG